MQRGLRISRGEDRDHAERYGIEHADNYRRFLLTQFEQLIEHPDWERPVNSYPGLRCFEMRKSPSRHGHAANYEVTPQAIRIVRISTAGQQTGRGSINVTYRRNNQRRPMTATSSTRALPPAKSGILIPSMQA